MMERIFRQSCFIIILLILHVVSSERIVMPQPLSERLIERGSTKKGPPKPPGKVEKLPSDDTPSIQKLEPSLQNPASKNVSTISQDIRLPNESISIQPPGLNIVSGPQQLASNGTISSSLQDVSPAIGSNVSLPVIPPYITPIISNSTEAGSSQPSVPPEIDSAAEALERNAYFASKADLATLMKLADRQTPRLFWFGCSDSRVPESLLIAAGLGEVFVERNIANIYKPDDDRTAAGMEYAIMALNITHIVLVGHGGCGGCLAALNSARADLSGKAKPNVTSVGQKAIAEWIAPIKELAVDMLKHTEGLDLREPPSENAHGWVYDLESARLKEVTVDP